MSSKLDAVQKVAVRACRKISGRKWMQEGEENRANADNINNKEPITGRRGTGSEYTCLSLQRSVLKACVRAAQLWLLPCPSDVQSFISDVRTRHDGRDAKAVATRPLEIISYSIIVGTY